jgi:hypothetical protein
MKKLLAIIVLGLLFSGNVQADLVEEVMKEMEKEFIKSGGHEGDPNKNIILDSTKDYIVIRNLTAKSKVINVGSYNNIPWNNIEPALVFKEEANNHCKKNKVFFATHTEVTKLDDHTALYICTTYLPLYYKGYDSKDTGDIHSYALCYGVNPKNNFYKTGKCKKVLKKVPKKYPAIVQKNQELLDRVDNFSNSSFVFKIKKRALAKKDETDKIEMASMVKKAQATCKDLGFKEATPEYSNCSLKLYTQSIELAAKNKQQIVHTQVNTSTGNAVSSGSNSVTIYDPVRDANRAIDRGMKMITGKCNDLAC